METPHFCGEITRASPEPSIVLPDQLPKPGLTMLPKMTSGYVLASGLVLAVGSLAVKVVSPGGTYEIDQQTWDQAMESPDAGDNYELQTGYDTKQKFPWLSYQGAEGIWSAEIRFASDVPTKDPGLFQAGTSLSLRPAGNEDLDTHDYSDQWYLCLNFLRVKKGSQAQRNDETCFSQLSFECRANLTDAAISSFDWVNGTASSPCHNFKLPDSCSGQVEPEYYVTGEMRLPSSRVT